MKQKGPEAEFGVVGHPEMIVESGAPSHHRRLPWGCGCAPRTALTEHIATAIRPE
jgi:hypothetical protein